MWLHRLRPRTRVAVGLLLVALVHDAGSAQERPPDPANVTIRVYSGGAPRVALTRCTAAFESRTGYRVTLTFDGVSGIRDRLNAGEQADVILLPTPMIEALEVSGRVRRDSRMVLARSALGVVVRNSAPAPDISSVEGFRAAVVAASSIAYSDPRLAPSGVHLTRVFERLGITEVVRPKTILRTPFDGGVALVAKGEAELGIYLVTEIKMVDGVLLVGLLPPELQSFVVYAGSVAADSPVAGAARTFLSFLSDPVARQYWEAAGFESLGALK